MCYKNEVQAKNKENLEKRLDNENVPMFIRKYFIRLGSKSAAITYWNAIRDLLNYLIQTGMIEKNSIAEIELKDFHSIMGEDIKVYLENKEDEGMSPTTLQTRKNIYSSFWGYLTRIPDTPIAANIIKDCTYKGMGSSDLIGKLPTEEGLKAMEDKILKKNDEMVRERNIAVFRVLKGSGIRESELAGLDMSDVHISNEEEMPYIKVLGKGKYRVAEARRVYLTGEATKALEKWLQERDKIEYIVDKEAVFINKNGKRLTESNIKAIFTNYGDGITPHMMRHYYATVSNVKFGLTFTRQNLGHQSSTTTVNKYINGAYGLKDALQSA